MSGPDDLRVLADAWEADKATIAQLTSDLAAARSELQAALTQHDTDVQTIAALSAQVDSLQAQLDECLNPTVPMLVGSATGGGVTFEQMLTKTGPLDVRHFYESSLPVGLDFTKQSTKADVDLVAGTSRNATIGSVKPQSGGAILDGAAFEARFEPYARSIPSWHPHRQIVWHEPEEEISGGQFSLVLWKEWQARARAVIDRVNVDRDVPIELVATLMAYSTEAASHRNIDDYRCPDGTHDALGWDGYNKMWKAKGVSESLPSIFSSTDAVTHPKGGPLEVNQAWDLPFLIIETGTVGVESLRAGGGPGEAARIAWLNDGLTWARDVAHAVSFTYWNNDLYDKWQLDTDAEYQTLGSFAEAA